MDVATFRTDFPEFSDTTKYPDPVINIHMIVAISLVNSDRWGSLTDTGIELCTAHNLVLGIREEERAAIGAMPGEVKGVMTSKSVDKVSASYDIKSVLPSDASYWNMTTYGAKFLQLALMLGAGGMQM